MKLKKMLSTTLQCLPYCYLLKKVMSFTNLQITIVLTIWVISILYSEATKFAKIWQSLIISIFVLTITLNPRGPLVCSPSAAMALNQYKDVILPI